MKSDRTNRICATDRRQSWPEGATAGILLVAATCVGLSITLYQLAGPRDAFAEEAAAR